MEIIAEKRIGRRILKHIRALAHPRYTGSAGERQAQRYVREVLRGAGYSIIEQPFEFSLFPQEALPRLAVALVCTLVLAALLCLRWSPPVAAELCLLDLLLLMLFTRWSGAVERLYRAAWFGRMRSKNIVALHPHQKNSLNVVFMAHYDSKSQTYSGATRFILYAALTALVLVNLTLVLLAALLGWDPSWLLIGAVPMTATGIALQLNATGNRSPGAYDNASGVGILLELAQSFAQDTPGVNLIFIATGAEEAGLCGAVALLSEERTADFLPPGRTIIINFDGIGSAGPVYITDRYGIPPARTAGLLSKLCLRIAERFGLPARRHWIPTGAAMDHVPFAAHGYQAVTISTAGWNEAFRSMHTPGDTADKLSLDALEQCFAIGRELVDSIPSAQYVASLN